MKVPSWILSAAAFVAASCLTAWGFADHASCLGDVLPGRNVLPYPWGLVTGVCGVALIIVAVTAPIGDRRRWVRR